MSRSIVTVQSDIDEVPLGQSARGAVTVPGWKGMGTATAAFMTCKTEFLGQAIVSGESGLAYMTTVAAAHFTPGVGSPRFSTVEVASSNVGHVAYVPEWSFGLPYSFAKMFSAPVKLSGVPHDDFHVNIAYASSNNVYHNGAPVPVVYETSVFQGSVVMSYDVQARQFGSAADRVNGTAYADSVDLGLGNDWFSGGRGNDYAWGGLGHDSVAGGAGNDTLVGMDGNDTLVGDDGDDLLSAGAGNDVIIAGSGQDQLAGGNGDDLLMGGDDGDKLDGGAGRDTLKGANDKDTLNGMGDDDQLFGGSGDDVLNGSAGNDLLFGEAGTDILIGAAGRDKLWGGGPADEKDIFVFLSAADSPAHAGRDVIGDFTHGTDRISLVAIDADPATKANDAFRFTAGPAAHAVWFSNGMVSVDVNGDSRADMWIELTGVRALGAVDFIL